MFPNDMYNYKIKPQWIPIGSFAVPKVAANSEVNAEVYKYIEPMDEESDALDEEPRIINHQVGK